MATDVQLERLAIRALCSGTPHGPVKQAIVPLLCQYRWRIQLHEVIFEALASIPSDDPATIRRLLPAKLTRLGFPDVEWNEFFAPLSLSRDEILVAVHQMTTDLQPS